MEAGSNDDGERQRKTSGRGNLSSIGIGGEHAVGGDGTGAWGGELAGDSAGVGVESEDDGKRKGQAMTNREKIEVMEAFERGEPVEFRIHGHSDWYSASIPRWNWEFNAYRVKPKGEKPELKRYELVFNDQKTSHTVFVNGELLDSISAILSLRSFRTGYFELNDGTKSKVPYVFTDGIEKHLLYRSGDESLWPVAVWLEGI